MTTKRITKNDVLSTVKFFRERYGYPESFEVAMKGVLDALSDGEISGLATFYPSPVDFDFGGLTDYLTALLGKYNLNIRETALFALVALTPLLLDNYKKANISEKIALDTIADFRFKYEECVKTEGKDGIRPWPWYESFFKLKLFALGRLQFQIANFKGDSVTVEGKTIIKGDKVIAVHIPKSGEPLSPISVEESFDRAKEFFKSEFNGKMPFTCWSWLLSPKNCELLPENSNVIKFAKRFYVFDSGEYEDFNDISPWIFDRARIDNLDDIPENSSLQKAIKNYLKKGNKLGWGYGVFLG